MGRRSKVEVFEGRINERADGWMRYGDGPVGLYIGEGSTKSFAVRQLSLPRDDLRCIAQTDDRVSETAVSQGKERK